MATFSSIIAQQLQIGGTQMSASNTLTGNAQESYAATLAAAVAAVLTARDGDTSGTITFPDQDHGFTTGDVVTLSWLESGVRKSRTDVATVVSEDEMAISGGDGDDLPTQDDPITVAIQSDLGGMFDGDDLVAIAATASRDATVVFYDDADAVLLKQELYAGNAWSWQSGQGTTTPITGNAVARIAIGNRSTSGTATFRLGLLQNV